MKKIIAIIIFIVIAININAQEEKKERLRKNALYTELGGNALLYSLNYERILIHKENFKLGGRIGISLIPGFFNSTGVALFPIEFNALLGKQKNLFEAGIGYLVVAGGSRWTENYTDYNVDNGNGTYSSSNYFQPEVINYEKMFFSFRLGYRHQSPNGFMWRIALNPLIVYAAGYKMEPYDNVFKIRAFAFQDTQSFKLEHGEKIPNNYNPGPYTNQFLEYKFVMSILNIGVSMGYSF